MSNMEINDENLDVSGGKIVETKEGKFMVVPDDALEFNSEEEAKASEKTLQYIKCRHGRNWNCKKPKSSV